MTNNIQYNLGAIRQLLLAAFTPKDLRIFCQDRSTFRPVVKRFSHSYSLDAMAEQLIDYCGQFLLFDELLSAIKDYNPQQYRRFELYLCDPDYVPPSPPAALPRPPAPSPRRIPVWVWLLVAVTVVVMLLFFVLRAFFWPSLKPMDNMDVASGWTRYEDGKGSSLTVATVPGVSGTALELSFNLVPDGWVGISKPIRPDVLEMLPETRGIRFYCRGLGASNTIELKLLYQPDPDGQSAVFGVNWYGVTAVADWTSLEATYDSFQCWVGTGCRPGEKLDLTRLWKLDFAISNKPGGTPGPGVVVLDQVELMD